MKNSHKYLVFLLFGMVGMFFLMKECQENPAIAHYESVIKKYRMERAVNDSIIMSLDRELSLSKERYDSLERVKQKVRVKVVQKEAEVDSAIKSDSMKAIVKYREGLQELEYIPDGTDYLSYREIGLGAKIFIRHYGLKLELKLEREENKAMRRDLMRWSTKYDISQNNLQIAESTVQQLEVLIKEVQPKWWQSPVAIIVYIVISFTTGIFVAL